MSYVPDIFTLPCEIGEVSDGYHTFNELYEHQYQLWVNLVLAHKEISFKTRKNRDGETLEEGLFILGMNTVHGQITYHLPVEYWHVAKVKEIDRNRDYDGHTADDVLIRLAMFMAEPR